MSVPQGPGLSRTWAGVHGGERCPGAPAEEQGWEAGFILPSHPRSRTMGAGRLLAC